jgi:hypothetical protein
LDITLGDLLEGLVLFAFEGKAPPFDSETLARIEALKNIYDMEYDVKSAHQFEEI